MSEDGTKGLGRVDGGLNRIKELMKIRPNVKDI